MVLSNGTPNNNKKINTKNSGLRHVSMKPVLRKPSILNNLFRYAKTTDWCSIPCAQSAVCSAMAAVHTKLN